MTVRVYVPGDSAALSVGAGRVAAAIAEEARRRGLPLVVARNGSRGLFWLEPLVEVETPRGRFAYGPVAPGDVASLFDAGFVDGGAHPRALGPTEDIPYLRNQQRLLFARCGLIEPLSIDDYRRHGGLKGLARALEIGPKAIIEEALASGLRGRGGAGFPTGIKWRTVAGVEADQKYIVCNADEGDSGTFADRMLLEGDPFMLIEGMAIAAVAVGATRGYVYIRSEYPHAFRAFEAALGKAREAGLLGRGVLGSSHSFDIEARLGAGAYICGEETSLLESLEGRRGQVRAKPPLPAIRGLFGKPTVINNVLSFASAPWILAHGGKAYAEYGVGRSRGTQPFQLAGNVRYGGLVELAFGADDPPTRRGFRRRDEIGPQGARGAGRRPAGRLLSRPPARHAPRLRGDAGGGRHARPWRPRGLRRHCRSRAPGAVRLRILRAGKLRQVHAVPDRLDARRGDHRQDHRRTESGGKPRAGSRPLRRC